MALSTPDSEPRLFHGPGPGLRLVLLVTLAVVLMVLDHRNQHLIQVRSLMAAALYPLQKAVSAPFAAARWAGDNLASRETLLRENGEFRRQLLGQAGQLQRMAALEAENARMRALLDSTARIGDDLLIAEIVAVDMDRQRHRIILNRGGDSGVAVGQALVDAHGVVGQVTRDRGASAEALLITDPDHAVPVELVRNGLRTIAVGTGDLDRLSLPFVARNADIKVGDLLVSSGLGGRFPAGYPVATVSEVRGDSGEAFLTVSARPEAELDRVREVLLVAPRPAPAPAATPDPVPAAAVQPKPPAPARPATTAPQAAPAGTVNAPPPAAATAPARAGGEIRQ